MSESHECLFFANDFPPIGGAGTQRPFYFAKYLPLYGWSPHVITVKEVAYPVKDGTLLSQLPADTQVYRTESLELRRIFWHLRNLRPASRSRRVGETGQDKTSSRVLVREMGRALRRWLFVPDDRLLWLPFALPVALDIARRRPITAVVATMPTHSSGIMARIVSRRLHRPLILDMRDPWTRDPYMEGVTPLHRAINRSLERQTLRAASSVVVISESMAESLRRDYPDIAHRVTVITNGYDAEEFGSIPAKPCGRGYVVAYVGSLYAHHRDAVRALRNAWALAATEDRTFAAAARFVVVGRIDPEIQNELATDGCMQVDILGYVPHRQAIAYSKGASALFFAIKGLDAARDVITIPGKLFEYLASGVAILMIGPQSDGAGLVESSGGRVHRQSDIRGIADSLLAMYRDFDGSRARREPPPEFDRKALTKRFAAVLDRAAEIQAGG